MKLKASRYVVVEFNVVLYYPLKKYIEWGKIFTKLYVNEAPTTFLCIDLHLGLWASCFQCPPTPLLVHFGVGLGPIERERERSNKSCIMQKRMGGSEIKRKENCKNRITWLYRFVISSLQYKNVLRAYYSMQK